MKNYDHALYNKYPIENTLNYTSEGSDVFIRVESKNINCFAIVKLEIKIIKEPVFNSISNFVNCESETTSPSNFFFVDKDSEIINDQDGMQVLYFETEDNAVNRENPIDKTLAYQNTSNPQTVYIRLENQEENSCYKIAPMHLEIKQAPIYNEPSDMSKCDYNNNGLNTFDLTEKVDEIAANSTQDLSITFHTSPIDAEIGSNEVPLNFSSSINPQEIYARVENIASACYKIEAFDLRTSALPKVNYGQSLNKCGIDYQLEQLWDLTEIELKILEGRQYGIEFTYFESENNLPTNEIANPEAYTNISNPQTVLVEVRNISTNCLIIVPFDLIIDPPPSINAFETYEVCETGDMVVDLALIDGILLDDSTDVIVTYHASDADAQANLNPLGTDYTYTNTSETIFARIEDATTNCYTAHLFQIVVNPLPVAYQPDNFSGCDDDFDGRLEFDLSQQNAAILNGQSSNTFSVYYFSSESDALENTDPLPLDYVAVNNQTIFARLQNDATSCFDITSFSVTINPIPGVNIGDQVLCLDNLPLIVSAQTNNAQDSYLWSNNATTPGNRNYSNRYLFGDRYQSIWLPKHKYLQRHRVRSRHDRSRRDHRFFRSQQHYGDRKWYRRLSLPTQRPARTDF